MRTRHFVIGILMLSLSVGGCNQLKRERSDADAEILKRIEMADIPISKFEPIPVERENGFYATVDEHSSEANKHIKLEEKPSVSFSEVLKIKKVYDNDENKYEIRIDFTEAGTGKFSDFTRVNFSKPIAIVIDHKIVSMPIVNAEINEGTIYIGGDFSEDEIDDLIVKLKK